jgi:hypothetical protein
MSGRFPDRLLDASTSDRSEGGASQGLRHGALERVVPQAQDGQQRQGADPGRHLAAQHVVVEDQCLETGEARHAPRDLAEEIVAAHVDDLQRREAAELARQRAPEPEPGQREHLEVREPRQRRDHDPDGEVPGQRRRGARHVELRHGVPVGQDGGRARRAHGAAAAVEVGAERGKRREWVAAEGEEAGGGGHRKEPGRARWG